MNNILGTLSICKKAGKLTVGADVTFDALEDYKARLLIFSSDCSPKTMKRFTDRAKNQGVPYLVLDVDKEEIGRSVSKASCSVCAVLDIGLANSIAKNMKNTSVDNLMVADKLEVKLKRKIEREHNKLDPNYVHREKKPEAEVIFEKSSDIKKKDYPKYKKKKADGEFKREYRKPDGEFKKDFKRKPDGEFKKPYNNKRYDDRTSSLNKEAPPKNAVKWSKFSKNRKTGV